MILSRSEKHHDGSESDYFRISTHSSFYLCEDFLSMSLTPPPPALAQPQDSTNPTLTLKQTTASSSRLSLWMNLCCSGFKVNLLSLDAGAMKLANKAALWYVPCSLQNVEKIMEVPPIKVACVEALQTAVHVLMCACVCVCVVRQCRAGGGGQETL